MVPARGEPPGEVCGSAPDIYSWSSEPLNCIGALAPSLYREFTDFLINTYKNMYDCVSKNMGKSMGQNDSAFIRELVDTLCRDSADTPIKL